MNATRKALDKATRHLHCEARFADPAWTGDRDQAPTLTQQEFFGGGYFLLPPHKPGSLHRKIRRSSLHLPNWLLREAVAYGCKFPCQISGRDVALIGFFGQAPLNNPTQRSGSVAVLRSDRFGLFPDNGHQRRRCCASLKSALYGHHLVEHQAERKLV